MQIKNKDWTPILPEACITLFAAFLFLSFLTLLPRINLYLALHARQNHDYIIHYYSRTEPEKALQFATQWADASPENPFYQLEAGSLNFHSGNMETAKYYLKKAGEIFYFPYTRYPDILSDDHCEKMATAYLLYGKALLSENHLSDSLFYFLYASDIAPDSYPQKVKPLLKEYVKNNNITESQHLLLSGFYIQKKDLERATYHLSQSSETLRDYHLLKGKILDARGDKEGAGILFSQESVLFPDNLSTYTSRAIPDTKKMREMGFMPLLRKDFLIRSDHVEVNDGDNPLYRGDALIQYQIPQDFPPESLFYVIARGDPAKGILPILEIVINNAPPLLVYVNDAEWRAYPIKLNLKKGESVITLRFPNDGCYGYQYDEKTGKGRFTENRDLFVNNIWYYGNE
jgi:hypothetical protein